MHFAKAALVLVAATGCRLGDTQTASESTAVTSGRLSPKKTLVACWDHNWSYVNQQSDIPMAEHLESVLATRLTQQYSTAVTGIQFTGLKECEYLPQADIKMMWDDRLNNATGYASHIGLHDLRPYDETSKKFFSHIDRPAIILSLARLKESQAAAPNGLTIEDITTELAVHELGHIAGLFHEHAHPQSTCRITRESAAGKVEFLGSDAYDAYLDLGTAYDAESIMSYCKLNALISGTMEDTGLQGRRLNVGLSNGDRQILKNLYGNKPDR